MGRRAARVHSRPGAGHKTGMTYNPATGGKRSGPFKQQVLLAVAKKGAKGRDGAFPP